MSSPKRKIYWDTSCFICFLNKSEQDRRLICEDILHNAKDGNIEIWISTWVIVEVIRPRRAGNAPLPKWAVDAIKAVPAAREPLEELWRRFQNGSATPKLTPKEISEIGAMFQWPWLRKIYVDERVANRAVELARDFGLKPADAVHAASAIAAKCEAIQRWDKDFDRVRHLIASEEPQMISAQQRLGITGMIGPILNEEFDEPGEETKTGTVGKDKPTSAGLLGSGDGHPEGKAGPEGAEKASGKEAGKE